MHLTYDFDIVGGPFDGAPGMMWADDGKHPPPGVIYVGVCGKGTDCGSSACRLGAVHVSFWTANEDDRPTSCFAYGKESEHVERTGEELRGRVVYAVGGLSDPRNFGAKAREPVTA